MYKRFGKRILDFIMAAIGLIILSPLFLLIVIILLFLNNGKVLFLQSRPGLNEEIFTILKFSTMRDGIDSEGKQIPDAERVTFIGKLLRRTSLDEIPQLWNVLKGDMSLVGPRPLLVDYLPYYTIEQKARHCVKPGITGLAQINGRNAISWEKKFQYDVIYAHTLSLNLDLRIIFSTISNLFTSKNSKEFDSMEKFSKRSNI